MRPAADSVAGMPRLPFRCLDWKPGVEDDVFEVPMSKEDHYLKGMDLFADDRMDEAVAAFDQALEEDAQYGDALHAAAMCCYHNKDLERALKYGLRYRDVEPDNPLAYTSLSMFYHAKGWIQEAEDMGAKAQAAALKQAQS